MEYIQKSSKNFSNIEHRINMLYADPNIHNIELANLESINNKLVQENSSLKQQLTQMNNQFVILQDKISSYETIQIQIETELTTNINQEITIEEQLLESLNIISKLEEAYQAIHIQKNEIDHLKMINSQQTFQMNSYTQLFSQAFQICQKTLQTSNQLSRNIEEADDLLRETILEMQKYTTEISIIFTMLDFPLFSMPEIDGNEVSDVLKIRKIIGQVVQRISSFNEFGFFKQFQAVYGKLMVKGVKECAERVHGEIGRFVDVQQYNSVFSRIGDVNNKLLGVEQGFFDKIKAIQEQKDNMGRVFKEQLSQMQQQALYYQNLADEVTFVKTQENQALKATIDELEATVKDLKMLQKLQKNKQKITKEISQQIQ